MSLAQQYARVLRGEQWPAGLPADVRRLGKDGTRNAYDVAVKAERQSRKKARERLDAIREEVDAARVVSEATLKEAERLRTKLDAPVLPSWAWVEPPRSLVRVLIAGFSALASVVVVVRFFLDWLKPDEEPDPEPEPTPEPAPQRRTELL